MKLELIAPTNPPAPVSTPRRSYKHLYNLLQQHPGEWVRMDLIDVAGGTPNIKQSRLMTACYLRGLKVQTTVEGEYIYVRLRTEVPCE